MASQTPKVALAAGLLVAAGALCFFAYRSQTKEEYAPPALGVEHWERKAKHSQDLRARCAAVPEIAKSEDPRAVPVLLETLKSKEPEVAEAAARWLGKRREKKAVEPLVKQLERKSTIVKFATIKALQRIGDPRALEGLKSQVTRENGLAADAAWAIGKLKDPAGRIPQQAEDALIGYLSSPVPKICLGAIYGLRDGGTERALPALEKIAADPLGGLDKELISQPVMEGRTAEPEWIGRPCREAVKAIRARTKQGGGKS